MIPIAICAVTQIELHIEDARVPTCNIYFNNWSSVYILNVYIFILWYLYT